jgi:predicted Zn-dependent protease
VDERAIRVIVAVASVACAVYLAFAARDAGHVQRANELALDGRFEEAVSEARHVGSAPADLRARLVEANALAAAGRPGEAADVMAVVARRDPENWIVRARYAQLLFVDGDVKGALREATEAKRLNPRLPVDLEALRN